jgi:hypothetical protein
MEDPQKESRSAEPTFRVESLRGRVVWLAEVLKSDFGITTVEEAAQNVPVLRTAAGKVYPILENPRGRAFRKDPRLREMDMELTVRIHEKQPFVQVVNVYQWIGKERWEVDYWCDVCAIVMFETGPCACCQDDNRLRKRRVVDGKTQAEERP